MEKKANRSRVVITSLSLKALFSVFLIVTGITVSMLVVYFVSIRKTVVREYQQLVQTSVSNIDRAFAQHMENADTYCQNFYSSVEGTRTRLDPAYARTHMAKFSAEIRDSFKILPFTQSVGIIDRENQLTLLIQNWLDTENQYVANIDALLLEELAAARGLKAPLLWTAPNRYPNRSDVPILTRYYREFLPSSEQFNGTVVMNINAQSLSLALFSSASDSGMTYFILSDRGTVAAHSDLSCCGAQWGQLGYVQAILTGKTVLQKEEIDGILYELYSIPSAVDGYYIVAQSKYLNELDRERDWMLSVIGITTLIVAFAAVLLWIVLRRVFRPFNQVMEKVKTSSLMENGNDRQDDVTVLRNYHSKLSANIDTLRQNETKNRIVKVLLSKKDATPLLLQNNYIQQGVPYYLIVAHLGEEKNMVKQLSEYDHYRVSLERLFVAHFEKTGKCTCFEIGFRRMLILVAGQTGLPVTDNALYSALNRLQKRIGADYPMATSLWVSEPLDWRTPERDLPSVFQTGEETLKTYRFINPEERLLQLRETPAGEHWRPLLDTVLQHTKMRDSIQFQRAVKALLESLQTQPWVQFQQTLLLLAIEITKIWNPEKLSEKYCQTMAEKLAGFTTKEELCVWLTELFDDATAWLQTVENHSTVQTMEKTVAYIQDNYADNDLNLNTLAEHVHISAPYLGKLFREFTGNSFNEYLLKIRMERAKTLLLLKRDVSISSIAQQVGYGNNSYFTSSFKKYFGVSPSKFRNYPDREDAEE